MSGARPAGLVGVPGTRSPVDLLRRLSTWPVTWLTCFDWSTLLGMAAMTAPATVVLDPGLAGPGVHSVITALRAVSACPVFLVASDLHTDPRSVGADGLLDPVRAAIPLEVLDLARAARPEAVPVPSRPGGESRARSTLRWSSLLLDAGSREAFWREQRLPVTELQFRLLWTLAEARGRVVSFAELSRAIYGNQVGADRGRIQAHVVRLRRLIEADAGQPRVLLTVWGQGLRLATDEPSAIERVS